MTNNSKTLYTGVTNNLNRRVYLHKNKLVEGFTKKCHINKLVYFELHKKTDDEIRREKQIKRLLMRVFLDSWVSLRVTFELKPFSISRVSGHRELESFQ